MKIVLNPEYKFLQQFVQDLPTRFASEGKVIQDKRNTIKVFEYKELEINVNVTEFLYSSIGSHTVFSENQKRSKLISTL